MENCINRQCYCQCNWFFSFRNVHISCVPDILYIWRAFSTFGCSDKVMQQKSGWSSGYYLCILKCHTNKSLDYPQVLQRSCTIFDNNNNSYYESCEWLLGFCLFPWIFQFSGSVRTQLHHYSLDDDAVFDLFVAMCQKMLSWDDELLMLTFYLCTFKHMHTYLELG